MLPHPHNLTLPLREGIRDLRTAIRLEAASGTLSARLLGSPEPTRRLAQVADGVLTRAERVAGRVLPRGSADATRALDRLAASLWPGAAPVESADLYALCRTVLALGGPNDAVVSELRLAMAAETLAVPGGDDDTMCLAARAAGRLAAVGAVRPCLTSAFGPVDPEEGATANDCMALTVWLAVLVRRDSGAPGELALLAAQRVVEAEGADWRAMLRDGRFADLAAAWRATVPYLP
ncbi:hypothetical protein [Aureimonas sp. SK2]|uniref:hypothetical protein n=1 Tax=Aureimonas sp. SK2 TaxID=3015992 RepID=UPI0024445901|nr:hypothetical protein [Aureimonas sp. SK2]